MNISAFALRVAFLSVTLFTSFSLKAQLVVDFEIQGNQNDTVCVPASRQFANLSTYNGVAINNAHPEWANFDIAWVIDPNPSVIKVLNPTVSYPDPGVFDVSLTITHMVTGETQTISRPGLIRAFAKPQPDFSLSTNMGCAPLQVQFTNMSVGTGSPIVKYKWAISGIGTSGDANPVFTFSNVASYNLNLEIEDANGCKNDTAVNNVVEIIEDPIASFSSLGDNDACTAPFSVDLKADEPRSLFNFRWEVESVGTLNGDPVTANFTTSGRFDVKLVVDGVSGCSDSLTMSDFVVIEQPTASFTLPAKLCAGDAVSFDNTSIGGATNTWDFGDGTQLIDNNDPVSHTYTDGGTFNVQLVVASANGKCTDTATASVTVDKVQADFVADTTTTCLQDLEVTFTMFGESYPPGSLVEWDFGDGSESFDENPTHTYQHLPKSNKNFNPKLTITSPQGCVKTVKKNGLIKFRPVIARITPVDSKADSCLPEFHSFVDNSIMNGFALTLRNWDLGDGNGLQPATGEPTKGMLYNDDDVHNIVLTIETEQGCRDTARFSFQLVPKPVANFTFSPQFMCADEGPMLFLDSSYVTIDGVNYDYTTDHIKIVEWRFGLQDTVVRDPNAFAVDFYPHYFASDSITIAGGDTLGMFDAQLIVEHRSCPDTIFKFGAYDVWGPLVDFRKAKYDCSTDSLTLGAVVSGYDFADSTFIWYLDGNPQDTLSIDVSDRELNQSGSQKYYWVEDKIKAPQGEHTIYLYAHNPLTGCDYLDSIKVNIPIDTVYIESTADEFCLQTPTGEANKITARAFNLPPGTSSNWMVNGSPPVGGTSLNYSAADTGRHILTYTYYFPIDDQTVCPRYLYDTVQVIHAHAAIALESEDWDGCPPHSIDVTGIPGDGENILNWSWTFKKTAGGVIGTHAGQDPDSVTFADSEQHQVVMVVQDDKCTGTYTHMVEVGLPVPDISLLKNDYCVGETIQVENLTSFVKDLDFKWELSNGDVSTDSLPDFVFTSGPDTLDLYYEITDGSNCFRADTFFRQIRVQPVPVFDIAADSNVVICPPLLTNVYANVTPLFEGYDYEWEIEGMDSKALPNDDTIFVVLSQSGTYDLKLIAETPAGCVDSIFIDDFFRISGPRGTLVQSRDTICAGDTVTFTVEEGVGINDIEWLFGDGNALYSASGTDTVKTNVYGTSTGKITPNVILDPEGCAVVLKGELFVNNLLAEFELNTDSLCGPQSDSIRLVDMSVGVNYDRTWDLGDGSGLIGDSLVSHEFDAGEYDIELSIADPVSGCSNSRMEHIWVFPDPYVDAGPDSILCVAETYELQGDAWPGSDYAWFPGTGLSDTAVAGPLANPTVTTRYYLEIVDSNLCSTVDSVWIQRDQSVSDFVVDPDTACGNLTVDVATVQNNSVGSNYVWRFGDGALGQTTEFPDHTYDPGVFTIRLEVYDLIPRCTEESTQQLVIHALPEIQKSNDTTICSGSQLQLIANGGDQIDWQVIPVVAVAPSGYDPVVQPLDTTTYIFTVTDLGTSCTRTDSIVVDIDSTTAAFDLAILDSCGIGEVTLGNFSLADSMRIDFGDQNFSEPVAEYTYNDTGTYVLRYVTFNKTFACADTVYKTVRVHPLPVITLNGDTNICSDQTVPLEATGGNQYSWAPVAGLSDPTASNPIAMPDTTTEYVVTVVDKNKCSGTDSVRIGVFEDFVYDSPEDTSIVIGESVSFNLNPSDVIKISWEPQEFLDCYDCEVVNGTFAESRDSVCYTIVMVDEAECYEKQDEVCIEIMEKYSVNVPSAFTPNGDGNANDVAFVRGWGIKRLIEFTVYNRWGEVVFQTDDISQGWDGTYKGVVQNDETYVYKAEVEYLNGEREAASGYITILK